MLKRRINIVILTVIILCSVSFYQLSFLASMHKMIQLAGAGIILVLILFHLVYSNQKGVKQNFNLALTFIIIALISSTVTSYVVRDQKIIYTLFAQRALYYYLLYFLLHQLKFDPKDLEKILIAFGVVYIGFHLLQTAIYPRIITDGSVRMERGTIRIYVDGADYVAAAFLIYLQRFLRSNHLKYLFVLLVIFAIYVMRGGRYALAIQSLTVVLFLIIDRRVRSRFFLVILGLIGSFAIFLIFQDIFGELVSQSRTDMAKGEDYVRIRATQYYLGEFNKDSPIAYITGNGHSYHASNYGKTIRHNTLKYRYYLSDIGLFGNYVYYGLFFVLGVLSIIVRTLRLRIHTDHTYVKYFFVAILIGLTTAGAFGESDFIGMIVIIMYLVDTSNERYRKQLAESKKVVEKDNLQHA
jgi:hypothetical protein